MNDRKVKAVKTITLKQLRLALAMLVLLFLVSGLLSLFFEPQIRVALNWMAEKFGFWGVSALVFVSDLFVSPISPDVALFFIAKSELNLNWPFYVSVIAAVSLFSGQVGWLLGRTLVSKPWAPRFIRELPKHNVDKIKTYGPLMVALGALTPMPFSLTCWTAGFLKMKYHRFFIASLFRVPRVYIAYWIIVYSDHFRLWFLSN